MVYGHIQQQPSSQHSTAAAPVSTLAALVGSPPGPQGKQPLPAAAAAATTRPLPSLHGHYSHFTKQIIPAYQCCVLLDFRSLSFCVPLTAGN